MTADAQPKSPTASKTNLTVRFAVKSSWAIACIFLKVFFQYTELKAITFHNCILLDPLFSLNAPPEESASHHTNQRKQENKEAQYRDAAKR